MSVLRRTYLSNWSNLLIKPLDVQMHIDQLAKSNRIESTELNEAEEGRTHLGEIGLALGSGDQVVHCSVHRHGLPVRVVARTRLELIEAAHDLRHVHPDALLELHVHLNRKTQWARVVQRSPDYPTWVTVTLARDSLQESRWLVHLSCVGVGVTYIKRKRNASATSIKTDNINKTE